MERRKADAEFMRRVRAVVAELIRQGGGESSFQTVAFGPAQSGAENDTAGGHAKDRRVTVRLKR